MVCVWKHVPCALAHVGIHMNGCMALWRPEVDAKSLTLHLTHWGWVSQVNVEHAGRLFQPAGLLWDFPCLSLLRAGITGGLPHSPGFCVGSDEGSKFWSSHLCDRYFNHWSSSPPPHYFFFWDRIFHWTQSLWIQLKWHARNNSVIVPTLSP